jgi:hypothetical protein
VRGGAEAGDGKATAHPGVKYPLVDACSCQRHRQCHMKIQGVVAGLRLSAVRRRRSKLERRRTNAKS